MSDPDLALAPLCAAAEAGRTDALAGLARAALDGGCPAERIREALLTVAPFCGFPRALDTLAAVRPVLGGSAPPAGEVADLAARGAAHFDRVYGRDAARVRAGLVATDSEVARWIESDAYGRVLARPGISASLRERIGVVLLAAQELRNQLKGHVRGALNCGATRDEVAAFVEAAAPWLPPAELAFARRTIAAEA
jgi:alkylhydroperoxidase/carboxymuconolactone decarboxylase family protein YurZ